MSERTRYSDPHARCPHCGYMGRAQYVDLPEWQMHWTDDNDEQHVEHMPTSRDYKCRDCDGEWIIMEQAA